MDTFSENTRSSEMKIANTLTDACRHAYRSHERFSVVSTRRVRKPANKLLIPQHERINVKDIPGRFEK